MVKQFVVDQTIKDIFKEQKRYKKYNTKDLKKTYIAVGNNDKIYARTRFYESKGLDIIGGRFTIEDCSVDLIYYSNSSLDYNRIVYINKKNKSVVKKYLPHIIKSVNTISDWFLECKYNPKYKYCRDKQYQDLLDIYEEE